MRRRKLKRRRRAFVQKTETTASLSDREEKNGVTREPVVSSELIVPPNTGQSKENSSGDDHLMSSQFDAVDDDAAGDSGHCAFEHVKQTDAQNISDGNIENGSIRCDRCDALSQEQVSSETKLQQITSSHLSGIKSESKSASSSHSLGHIETPSSRPQKRIKHESQDTLLVSADNGLARQTDFAESGNTLEGGSGNSSHQRTMQEFPSTGATRQEITVDGILECIQSFRGLGSDEYSHILQTLGVEPIEKRYLRGLARHSFLKDSFMSFLREHNFSEADAGEAESTIEKLFKGSSIPCDGIQKKFRRKLGSASYIPDIYHEVLMFEGSNRRTLSIAKKIKIPLVMFGLYQRKRIKELFSL